VAARGGSAALCDLDGLTVRAVVLFGPMEAARWLLPIYGRQRLTIHDLQRANDVRSAISVAFGIVDKEQEQGQQKLDAGMPAASPPAATAADAVQKRPALQIEENPEIARALGTMLALVGDGPLTYDSSTDSGRGAAAASVSAIASSVAVGATASASGTDAVVPEAPGQKDEKNALEAAVASGKPLVAGPRELGDVWINLEEIGGCYDDGGTSAAMSQAGTGQVLANNDGTAGDGPFFSFDVSVEELAQGGGTQKPHELDQTPGEATAVSAKAKEPQLFALLPELTLRTAILKQSVAFRQMRQEAKQVAVQTRRDARQAARCLRDLRETVTKLEFAVAAGQRAWDLAMAAESQKDIGRAMKLATSTMQGVNGMAGSLLEGSEGVSRMCSEAVERLARASEGEKTAPCFWASAVTITRTSSEKLSSLADAIAVLVQDAEQPKCVALRKADDTVKLINEKMQRWADEQRILQEEAKALEQSRMVAAQKAAEEEQQRQKHELRRQQEELAQRREAAIQWGRNLVEPMPNLVYSGVPPPPPEPAPPATSRGAMGPPPPPPPEPAPMTSSSRSSMHAVPPPPDDAPRLPPGRPPQHGSQDTQRMWSAGGIRRSSR